MSVLRPSAALVAAAMAFTSPAVAQTTQRGAVRIHRDATITFTGTVGPSSLSSCPAIKGDMTVQLGDKGTPNQIRVDFDGKRFEKTGDPRIDSGLTREQAKLASVCKPSPKGSATPVVANPVYAQLQVAADATVIRRQNGCLVTRVTVTPYIDASGARKTEQVSLGRIALPDIEITKSGGAVTVSAQGQKSQVFSREDIKGSRIPQVIRKACGL